MTVRTIDDIFRDFFTDGVPASGPFNPHKPDIRDTLKALTEGSENFPDNRVIRLNNANAGTPNNIVVTASVAIPVAAYQVLYILNVTQENTGAVTVSGVVNRTLVTNTNRPVDPGYLQPGMALLCVDTGTELRMLSYGDAEAVVTEAERVLDELVERSVGAFASDADAEQYLADRSLSAGDGTIYFNTSDKFWKYWDGSAWQAFPYATVGDGAVTDAKLPAFSPTSSPSSAKMRYQASTSAGALAAAIQRPVDLKLSDLLNASDFGVKADGVTNDTAAMVAAFAAMEATGRPLFLPSGVIMANPDALFIGNGSETNGSTYNGQKIIGAGASIANAAGTIIRARQAGNILFEVNGIIGGINISGIQFDCANLANSGIVTHSMSESVWTNFHISNFKFYGFRQLCRQGPAASAGWSAGCSFNQFLIASQFVGAYGAGIDVDGKPLNNYDPHRNTWSTGTVAVNRFNGVGATSAMILGFADSNTFVEVDFAVNGGGQGYGVTYNSLTRTAFPQNNFMYGCSVTSFNVIEDGSHVSGTNLLVNHTTQDGETLPTHSKIIGFTDIGQWLSNLQVNKDFGDVIWRNRAGNVWWRIRNNSGSGGDNFLNIEKSADGFTWALCVRFDASDGLPWFNIPTVGLRKMTAGDVDTGGAGFRRLTVAN